MTGFEEVKVIFENPLTGVNVLSARFKPEIFTNELSEDDKVLFVERFILLPLEETLDLPLVFEVDEFSIVVVTTAFGWRTFLSSSISFIVCSSTSSKGVDVSPSKSEISKAFLPFPPKLSFFLCPVPGATTGWRISVPTFENIELEVVGVIFVSWDSLETFDSVEVLSNSLYFEAFNASAFAITSFSRLKSY